MAFDKDSDQSFEEFMNDDREYRIEKACEGSGSIEEFRKEETYNNDVYIQHKLKITDNPDFVITGSRAWEMNRQDSDYDFICEKPAYELLLKRLKKYKLEYKEHDHFSSLYTSGEDGLFNIICLDPYEFKSWVFATKAIRGMVKSKALNPKLFENKNKVYGIFQMMRAIERIIY